MNNIKKLYKGPENGTKFYNDYTRMVSEATSKSIHEEGPKIPKQMLEGLLVALVQVKAGNTSANLLNEIRQIIFPFYRAKEITERVYNQIMNSTKF